MKKIDYKINDETVNITVGDESAIFMRRPDADGLMKVLLPMPVLPSYVALINDSGIAEVTHVNIEESAIYFRRNSFFETYLMCDLITDILLRNENENK